MDHVISLTLCVDNDAFGITYDEQATEVARILRHAATKIESNPKYLDPFSGIGLCLNDLNGNRVGVITPNELPLLH